MKTNVSVSILAALLLSAASALAANLNGAAGQMPAYHDGELFTINLMELSDDAAAKMLQHNSTIQLIFMSEEELPSGDEFVSVITSVPGLKDERFSPLWQEVEVEFTAGNTPHQFVSEDEIFAAAAAGEITLDFTDEVYRCSVVGP
jgi:hypothetical protein